MNKDKKRWNIKRVVKLCIIIFAAFSLFVTLSITIVHMIVFRRADYDEYDSKHHLLYSDLNAAQYPREEIKIQSGDFYLSAYLYGAENKQGLIVISPGHRDANDIKLYEITYFVDAGWAVLCYDYTGCYSSQGNNMIGYTQAVYDLDAVLQFVEQQDKLKSMPVMLFGHSLGGYASAAILQYKHNIKAAIIASGFDTPKEQWNYSIKKYANIFYPILKPYTNLFLSLKYGKESVLSAIDGINATDTPILVISGTDDSFYGGESPIYKKRNLITNSNCSFKYMQTENHNGHYDYFLTDAAIEYRNQVSNNTVIGEIDKNLYAQHDITFMNNLNNFLLTFTSR